MKPYLPKTNHQTESSFSKALQKRIAYLAIGRSSLRNQGAVGVIEISRNYTSKVNLQTFATRWNVGHYSNYLDAQTSRLLQYYPKKISLQFGTARKALNLFFRDIVSNLHMVKLLKLKVDPIHLDQLELPLDSYTAKEIISHYPEMKKLWNGVKHLTNQNSFLLQQSASKIADTMRIARVQLDMRPGHLHKRT